MRSQTKKDETFNTRTHAHMLSFPPSNAMLYSGVFCVSHCVMIVDLNRQRAKSRLIKGSECHFPVLCVLTYNGRKSGGLTVISPFQETISSAIDFLSFP